MAAEFPIVFALYPRVTQHSEPPRRWAGRPKAVERFAHAAPSATLSFP